MADAADATMATVISRRRVRAMGTPGAVAPGAPQDLCVLRNPEPGCRSPTVRFAVMLPGVAKLGRPVAEPGCSAAGGIRTHMSFRTVGFEPTLYACSSTAA